MQVVASMCKAAFESLGRSIYLPQNCLSANNLTVKLVMIRIYPEQIKTEKPDLFSSNFDLEILYYRSINIMLL